MEGYLIIRDALTPKDVASMASCFQKGMVDYETLLPLVDTHMVQRAGMSSFSKIRVSDNNNSTDAGAFHRDVICPREDLYFPGYTVLTYLDETTMEIIPDSHVSPITSIASYKDAKKIVIRPGDLLIFSSTLLHRGIFTERLPHRRLIQLFEVYTTQADAEHWQPRIMHVPGDVTHGNLMISLSKNPLTVWLLNILGFINAASGYGNARSFLDEHAPTMWAFSSEGLCGRMTVAPGTLQPTNAYIITTRAPPIDMPRHLISKWRWQLYTRQTVLYTLVIIGFLGVLIALIQS